MQKSQNKQFIITRFPDITNKEKEELQKRVDLKGWYVYEKICRFLETIRPSVKLNALYSCYMYDKRIRKEIFKYTGMIEEWCRSLVYDDSDFDKCSKIENEWHFGELITYLSKKNKLKQQTIDNLFQIKELRNNVCHQNLLLINDDGSLNKQAYDAIRLIPSLLYDEDIKKTFKADIEKAYSKKINTDIYGQTTRRIPLEIKVKLK